MPSGLAIQREELLLNLLTPEGDTFLLSSLSVAHSVPLCRETAWEEKEQQKSQQTRSIAFHSFLLGPVLSSLQCHYFQFLNKCYFPSSPSHWKLLFVPSVSPGVKSYYPTILLSSAPQETSLVSFPLGQQYPLQASESKIRKRGKEGSVLCLENLKKWSIEGIVNPL